MQSLQAKPIKQRDFSFASPNKHDTTVIKTNRSLLREYDSPSLLKQNQFYSNLSQTFRLEKSRNISAQQLQMLNHQHVAQVQKLMLEIARLHDLVRDMEKQNIIEVQKVRDYCQNQTYLHVSSLKQNHAVRVQNLQIQIKKARQQIELKEQQCRELQKKSYRDKQNLYLENQRLKNQIKALIQKKNSQIFNIKVDNQRQMNKRMKQNQIKIQQLKEEFDQQTQKLKRLIEEQSRAKNRAQTDRYHSQGNVQKLMQEIQNQKEELKRTLALNNLKANQRAEAQRNRLTDIMNHQLENNHKTTQFQVEMLKDQINRLIDIIKMKDQQIQKLYILAQKGKLSQSLELKRYQNQNDQLKEKIKSTKEKDMQQLQLLKVKMAALHEADIKELMILYQTKIEGYSNQLRKGQQQTNRLRAHLHQQIHKKYEMKKKYDISISRLNSKILQLRTGMNSMENQLKDKLDNQRSIMLLTSKSFIKQTQLKNNNAKFYQEELRKLRQLLDVQALETAVSQKNVEEKIKMAEQQLSRLTNKIIKIKDENAENQERLKRLIQQKDVQIKVLNEQLNAKRQFDKQQAQDQKSRQIEQLKSAIQDKLQKIKSLQDKCYELQTKLSLCKSQLEQMRIDNQISGQQAKDKYQKIADANLKQMKSHYQRRVHQLQGDKQQLQKINTSQMEKITQLVQRYNQLQHGMNQLIRQSKKLSQLEQKVINLGTDNNLVKNMTELFRE